MNCKRTLLALVIAAVLASPIQSMGSAGAKGPIEGTWVVTVTLKDPNLPPFFEALETYNQDGGVVTSNNMPFLTRVGQGAFTKIGNHRYLVKIEFFKFDENGLPSGTITVTHTINLNNKNEYSGIGTAVFCELDGTTCVSAEFETEGRRLIAEP